MSHLRKPKRYLAMHSDTEPGVLVEFQARTKKQKEDEKRGSFTYLGLSFTRLHLATKEQLSTYFAKRYGKKLAKPNLTPNKF